MSTAYQRQQEELLRQQRQLAAPRNYAERQAQDRAKAAHKANNK